MCVCVRAFGPGEVAGCLSLHGSPTGTFPFSYYFLMILAGLQGKRCEAVQGDKEGKEVGRRRQMRGERGGKKTVMEKRSNREMRGDSKGGGERDRGQSSAFVGM